MLYHTCSVAVTPAPVRFPTQGPLVPSFTLATPGTFQTTLVCYTITKIKIKPYWNIFVTELFFLSQELKPITNIVLRRSTIPRSGKVHLFHEGVILGSLKIFIYQIA